MLKVRCKQFIRHIKRKKKQSKIIEKMSFRYFLNNRHFEDTNKTDNIGENDPDEHK